MALLFATALHAQVVTSGMTGVVRDPSGKALAGATVTAVHVPTGTTYRGITNESGRYNFRGMVVGGPYTVSGSAGGYRAAERKDVETQLGSDIDVSFGLQATDVVTLEKFVVAAAPNELDSSAVGAGNVFDSARLAAKPTTQRSLADLISASTFVTLRSLSGDREEAQITALGQNNRYNSIQIDGSRINDQFGLNGTGLASFYNPLSLDTLEQLSVQVSPYDVRQAGFTGASINAVTKRGTNQFRGSAYYYFSGDHFGSLQLQGEDVATRATSGVKFVPKLERITKGGTLGGPILKDRLFFFVNYEKFIRTAPPSTTGMTGVDATQLASIRSAFTAYNTASGKSIQWGDLGGAASNVSNNEIFLAKLDWNITSGHRASVRYSKTKGLVPQFGSFVSTTRTNTTTVPSLTANAVTAFDSNFYSQERQEKNLTAQVFSQWSPNLKTEIKFGTVEQPQITPVNTIAPEVSIYGVTGLTRNNVATNGGLLVAGTDLNRQGNEIGVETKQYSAVADYLFRNFVFTGGYEREYTDYYNLFRSGSYGQITFASVADFVADRPARIDRTAYDPKLRPVGDLSDFATNGIFAQAKWNVNSRLNVNFGLRYEFSETEKKPALNQQLLNVSGFRNNGTLDGQSYLSPRLSFNLALEEERRTQLRGGVGHFVGRAPWVLFSNSYNNIGAGSFALIGQNNPGQGSFASYLRTFDPANPIGTGTDNPSLRRQIDFADPGIKLPSVWRGNIAIDRQLPFLSSTVTIEFIHTRIDQALFITNENIRATTLGADGRQRYAGNPSTLANARYGAFTDIYRLKNVSAGYSSYGSISWSRPMKNSWAFDVSYTRGRSTEAQAVGQTTASGQWQRNVIFNQSVVENGTSDFEIRDRVLVGARREFRFWKKAKTLISLSYEGRSGNPFSWIYANDLNGDGQSNDAIAVPSGPNDPRFDFSGLTAAQSAAMFSFIQSSGLSRYAGGVAPKNSYRQPWVNKLDLHVSQTIPLQVRTFELEVFADWINFGSFLNNHLFNYYEEAFRQTNDVFRRQFIGQASYSATGLIRPTSFGPDTFVYDNTMSRWRIQFGARLRF